MRSDYPDPRTPFATVAPYMYLVPLAVDRAERTPDARLVPRYELTTDEELAAPEKATLARDITNVHVKVTGAPASIVHVVFLTTGPGNTFVAGEARSGTYLQGSVRAGRDSATTTRLLTELAASVSRITGAPSSDVVVALRETPGRLIMEGGRILPDPGNEDDSLRSR